MFIRPKSLSVKGQELDCVYVIMNINKLVDMLSRPFTSKITTLRNLMHMDHFTHDAYKEAYKEDEDFKELFQQL